MLPTLLRFKDLKERGIAASREQLSKLIENYDFPRGRWMAPNSRVWLETEIMAWLDSRPIATENKRVRISAKHISHKTRKSAEAA